jgi:hypothetical protein
MDLYNGSAQLGEATEETVMTFEEYQEYKASCEEVIATADAAAKLAENPDFKLIFMENLFDKEPARLGKLMASGRMTQNGFDGAVKDLQAIGYVKDYLSQFIQKGNIAREELAQLEQARNEALEAGSKA